MKLFYLLLVLCLANAISIKDDGDDLDLQADGHPKEEKTEPFKIELPEGSQSQTIDATKSKRKTCNEELEYSELQLEKEVDWFSRTLNKTHWDNALEIFENLQSNKSFDPKGKLLVHTFELYDKAFSFPRVRKYKET